MQCSVVPRQRCNSRHQAEQRGEAYWSMWDGLIYPVTVDAVAPTPYSWGECCPFCGGQVRLGIRQQISSYRAQADGEGDE